MKMKELRSKNKEELQIHLGDLMKDLKKVRTEILEKKEKNVKKTKYLKKDVARVLTFLAEVKNA